MPDRFRARVVVTALLILLTVAGIRAIGPAGDWAHPAGSVLVVGLLLEAAFVAMYLGLRWRHAPPVAELAGKLNKIVSAALVACMIGMLLVIVLYELHFKPGQPRHRPGRVKLPHGGGPKVRVTRFPKGPSLPLRDLIIAILIAALITVMIVAWRRRRQARIRLAAASDVNVDEAADDLARAVESGRMALRDIDDARAAIIACYVAMEKSLEEVGAARGAAETPDELLVRTVTAGLVPPVPAGLLTDLFYEARYSTHHMPTSKREQAERALADLAAGLPAGERT
jgi:hypothetical protein